MDIQNLIKQFSNFNLPNTQNFQGNNNSSYSQNKQAPNEVRSNLYPECFNTGNFNANNFNGNQNQSCNACNINNSNPPPVQNSENPLGNMSSLLNFLPLLSGKPNLNSLASSESLPDNLKSFAPLIGMLSNSGDKSSKKNSSEIEIDKFKKVED